MRELTNIERIREFQKKLNEKAKANPKYRFYSLYDKTYRMDILEEAYRRVKANGGTGGVDGEDIGDIERKGIKEYLEVLQKELKEEQYKPKPVKRVYIQKQNGKQRPLGIPTIRDRIVQTSLLMILEPIFEADFKDSSYGFRPNKSAHEAVREIYKYLNWGCTEIYDVDLEKYFETVEHWKLLRLLSRRISDGKILRLIKQWLTCGYIEDEHHKQSKRGTPQGGVISPLLANVYLHPVDEAFERRRIGTMKEGSIHLIRYADDILILARKDIDKGIALLEHYVERLGLKINEEKTKRIKLVEGNSVDFLGFRFHQVKNKKTGKRLNLIYPSPESQKRCKSKIKKLIHHSIPLKVKDQIENFNRFMEGWTNYYKLGNSGKALNKIAQHVNRRVRRVIQRRKGNSGYGWHNRISSEYIYGKLGLFYNYKVEWL